MYLIKNIFEMIILISFDITIEIKELSSIQENLIFSVYLQSITFEYKEVFSAVPHLKYKSQLVKATC